MDSALKQRIRRILNSSYKRINEDLDLLQQYLEVVAAEIYTRDFDDLDAMAKREAGLSEAVATLIEISDFRDFLDEAESAVAALMGDLKKGPDKAIRGWIRCLQELRGPAVLIRRVRKILESCEESRERRRAAGEDLPPLRPRIEIACVVHDGVEPALDDLAAGAVAQSQRSF